MQNNNGKWIITFGSLSVIILTILGLIWNASAKNAKFEATCEKQSIAEKVLAEHQTAIALTNTSVAVLNTKLDAIITNQQELKNDFNAFKIEIRTNYLVERPR